uniref:GAG-pre-integrase domain-containing protein n=1 Tax=Chenopodium quinoa TaxID=63459 RepID=A0A803KNI2_CHEQI
MKLNNKFNNTRSNILMMQPLPSISHAYRLLIQEEKQRELSIYDDQAGKVMAVTADYKKNQHHYQSHRPHFKILRFSKKVAALVHSDDQEAVESEDYDAQVTHISMEQYSSILKALQSQDISASSAGDSLAQPESSAGAYVAGQFMQQDTSLIGDTSPVANLEEAKLWHLRLGHISFNKLHLVKRNFNCTVADNQTDHWCNLVAFDLIPAPAKALINALSDN